MQSASFRFVSIVISTILLASLVLVVVLAIVDNSGGTLVSGRSFAMLTTDRISSQPTPDAIPPAVTPEQAIAERMQPALQRVRANGFSFLPPAGFVLDLADGTVTLSASETSPSAGAVFVLYRGERATLLRDPPTPAEPDLLQATFDAFITTYAAEQELTLGASGPIEIDGVDGLSAALTGGRDTVELAGAIAMAQPAAGELFTLLAIAPTPVWSQSAQQIYTSLIESTEFFTAIAAATPTTAKDDAPVATATVPTTTQEPTATEHATETPSPVPTATLTLQAPAATPTPAATEAPPIADTSLSPITFTPEWRVLSNGNFVNGVAIMRSTLWAATSGGVVAWNKTSGGYVKFTTIDGLATNHTIAAESCPLPGLGVLFASNQGLLVFDTQNGSWRSLNSVNSPMSFDDVEVLHCDEDAGVLVVGYAQHGLDIFDLESGEWSHISQNNGLQFNIVRDLAVTEDRETIWVASQLGLSSLQDGETQLYNTDNSPLAVNDVGAIAIAADNTVWLGAGDNLYQLDGQDWTTYNQETVQGANFPRGRITGLDIGTDGSIWIGSDQVQVCRFDPVLGRCIDFFVNQEGMASAALTSIRVGEEGNVYYTTAGAGVSMFDGESWRTFTVDNEILPGNAVHDLKFDANGNLWVATNAGAVALEPESAELVRAVTPGDNGLPSYDIQTLQPIDDLQIWFGSEGVTLFDGDEWQTFAVADGLVGSSVQAIAIDGQQRTWIGTRSGLSIWTGTTFFNLTAENGLPSVDITALMADNDVVWIGTRGGGLLRFQDNQLQVFSANNVDLPSNVITDLALDSAGALLVGTDRGLARFVDSQIELVPAVQRTRIEAIATGSDGTIWVAAAEQGLLYFTGESWQIVDDLATLPDPQIESMVVGQDNSLWIGSARGGLAQLIP